MNYQQSSPAITGSAGTTKVNLNGLSVYYNPHIDAQKVTISYNGLLHHDGAQAVYLHASIGNTGQVWNNPYDYQMHKTCNGWKAEIPLQPQQPLNFCFKDCANNWDNNSGHNWSITVNP